MFFAKVIVKVIVFVMYAHVCVLNNDYYCAYGSSCGMDHSEAVFHNVVVVEVPDSVINKIY